MMMMSQQDAVFSALFASILTFGIGFVVGWSCKADCKAELSHKCHICGMTLRSITAMPMNRIHAPSDATHYCFNHLPPIYYRSRTILALSDAKPEPIPEIA